MKTQIAIVMWKDGYGGAERSIRNLAVCLDSDQLDMRFYFLSGQSGPFADEIVELGHTVKKILWCNGSSLAERWRLLQVLRRFEPMIVHDHIIITPFTRPLVNWHAGFQFYILNTGGAAMRHAVGQGGWRRLVESFDLPSCDRVLTNSYASQKAVWQTCGVHTDGRVETGGGGEMDPVCRKRPVCSHAGAGSERETLLPN